MSTQSTIHDTKPEAEWVLIELIRNKPAHVRLGEAIAAAPALQCSVRMQSAEDIQNFLTSK